MHLCCALGDLEHRQASHLEFILGVAEVILRWQVLRRLIRPLLFLNKHFIKSFIDFGKLGISHVFLISLTFDEQLDLAS